jgi:hypothetical protein
MGETGIDITAERPKALTADAVRESDVVITMGQRLIRRPCETLSAGIADVAARLQPAFRGTGTLPGHGKLPAEFRPHRLPSGSRSVTHWLAPRYQAQAMTLDDRQWRVQMWRG